MPHPAPAHPTAAAAAAVLALLLTLPAAARPLAAQRTAPLAGVVIDDVSGGAVPGARVTLGELRGEQRTDEAGRFRFEAALSGARRLRIEAPGYTLLEVEVTIPGNPAGDAVYRLTPEPVEVEGLEVKAEASVRLREFEKRRSRSTGGRFLTRRELASRESSTLADVLRSSMPGARLVRSSGGAAVHLASRSATAPGALLGSRPCYAQIYIDGTSIYGQHLSRADFNETPPDLGIYGVRDLEAVEYYSNPASTPVEFRTSSATCGTLVLWTRER